MKRNLLALIGMALSAALILGIACGGGGGGTPNPVKIYNSAGEEMATLTAFHIDGTTEGGQESGPFSGDFMAPDKAQFSITSTDEQGQTQEFGQLQAGDQVFVKNPFGGASEDWFVYAEDLFGPPGDVIGFFQGLWTELSNPTYVGEEDIDGVATRHLQGSLAPEVLGLIETEPAPTENTTIDLWVGKDDSRVLRFTYTLAATSAITTVDFSRFDDETISIVAPANPLPATELVKQFIAAAPQEEQDCLRDKWGDAAFEELKAGTRLPTQDEQGKGEECGGP